MILSMTGFASKTVSVSLKDGSKVNISINLKTLNTRFFETTCKLSHSINHLETEFINKLKAKLLRGHAYLNVHILNPQELQTSISASIKTIEEYIKAIEQIKKITPVEGKLSISDLLNLPDIFEVKEKEIEKDFEQKIFTLVENLADLVTKTRKNEGISLKKDLNERFKIIKKEISFIEKKAKKLIEKKKKEISELIKDINIEEDEATDARKSALYISLDKMDIHEEIVRFKSHLENIIKQLDSAAIEKGKRLDFTLQELSREINTLSSKCADAIITAHAINIKVELEKCREQTQNIV